MFNLFTVYILLIIDYYYCYSSSDAFVCLSTGKFCNFLTPTSEVVYETKPKLAPKSDLLTCSSLFTSIA